MTFLDHTQNLLKQRSRELTYEKLEELSGLDNRWISAFACNASKDFGVRKVQILHDCLVKLGHPHYVFEA